MPDSNHLRAQLKYNIPEGGYVLRLVYFPSPGRAEAIRVALSISGVEWEDISIDGEQFSNMKESGDLPWGMVPILRTPQGTIAESSAILRFVGHLSRLVPDDPFQRAKADEFIDGMEPLSIALNSTFGVRDLEERVRMRKEIFGPEGKGSSNLRLLERKVSESLTGWAAGTDEMSIADLKLFTGLFGLFSGNYDGIDASILADFPGLIEYHGKVSNEPRIKEHYSDAKSDEIRWIFLPDAFEEVFTSD